MSGLWGGQQQLLNSYVQRQKPKLRMWWAFKWTLTKAGCKCVVVRLTLCMHVHSSWNDAEKNSMATSCMTKDDRHKSRMPQTVAQKRRGKRSWWALHPSLRKIYCRSRTSKGLFGVTPFLRAQHQWFFLTWEAVHRPWARIGGDLDSIFWANVRSKLSYDPRWPSEGNISIVFFEKLTCWS